MGEGLRLTLAAVVALLLTQLIVPIARAIAERTGFFDHPAGYKQHGAATPYLGGLAVIGAFLIATAIATDLSAWITLIGCIAALCVIGTIDDRVGAPIVIRLVFQVACAIALWAAGTGWVLFDADGLNLVVSVLWVVGLINALNLMDNQDGAAASVAAGCCFGIAFLSQTHGGTVNAVVALALAGACLGFLRFNLAQPSRIFLGDGGSMPIGLAIAALVMAAPWGSAGIEDLLIGIPLAGLLILDTSLVVFSRRRRGVAILSGARDHLTHRLLSELKTPRRVALVLGVTQAGLGLFAALLYEANAELVGVIAAGYIFAGIVAISALDTPRWLPGLAAERAQVVEELPSKRRRIAEDAA